MTPLTIGLLAGGLCMAIAAGFIFAAAVRGGQLDDLEEVKFQMLRENHDVDD